MDGSGEGQMLVRWSGEVHHSVDIGGSETCIKFKGANKWTV